ncbi:MAG: hypothetical protein QW815_05960 [Nitrososphaerota archaeon]
MALEGLSIAYYKRFKVTAKEQVELLKGYQETSGGWPSLTAGKRTL